MCMDEAIVKRSKLYYLNIGKMSHIDELYYIAYLLTRTRETDNIVRRQLLTACVGLSLVAPSQDSSVTHDIEGQLLLVRKTDTPMLNPATAETS